MLGMTPAYIVVMKAVRGVHRKYFHRLLFKADDVLASDKLGCQATNEPYRGISQ